MLFVAIISGFIFAKRILKYRYGMLDLKIVSKGSRF